MSTPLDTTLVYRYNKYDVDCKIKQHFIKTERKLFQTDTRENSSGKHAFKNNFPVSCVISPIINK